MKISPVEAELLHSDRRTDMTTPKVASQFCERAKNKHLRISVGVWVGGEYVALQEARGGPSDS